MEGSKGVGGSDILSEGRPPNPPAGVYRQSFSGSRLPSACKETLVRHPSLMRSPPDVTYGPELVGESCQTDFIPIIRSGAWSDIGFRTSMEDAYIVVDNFLNEFQLKNFGEGPNALLWDFVKHPSLVNMIICPKERLIFDGHGGKHAADFACNHLPHFILEDVDFPREIERVVASAFRQTDTAFAEACSVDTDLASGTTALAALVVGSSLVVANAGDCRALLCCRGKVIEMSRDHKPVCSKERKRIEASGGYVYDGYLNGQLNVARALGDWHMEGMKDRDGGPLSAEPELEIRKLTEEDEFLIMGCDGIWDVFRSQNAVDFARRKLQEHNDPAVCCKELVDEALKRKSGDNLAVVVVCFHSKPPPKLATPRGPVQRSISAECLKELQSFLDSLGD